MAIGRLGSFKTSTTVGLNTSTALYTSTGALSKVTVHVTNQGTDDAIFSIGISSGTAYRDSDFIVFGQTIKKGTYAAITNIGVCQGETIFARANETDVSFIAHSVLDYDPSIGALFGRQESVRTSFSAGPATVNTPVVLYTAPRAAQVSVAINNTSSDDATYSIGISSGALIDFTSSDYIVFGQSLPRRTTQIIDSIGIGTGQSLIVKSNESDVTFVAYDLPTSVLEKNGFSYSAQDGFFGNLTGNVNGVGVNTLGIITSSSVYVTGVSTFVGVTTFFTGLFANQFSAAGFSTFTGITTSTSTLFTNQLSASGVSTFVGVTTSTSTLFTNQLNAAGVSTFVGFTSFTDGVYFAGVTTVSNLSVLNPITGPGFDGTIVAYSVVFGS